MPRTSTSAKPKHPDSRRSAAAPKSSGAAEHKALRAAKLGPVLTQELKGSLVPADIPAVHPVHFSSALELLGFMSRTTGASLTLPWAMMRCRTPFEMWSEQNKLLQGVFTDFQKTSTRMVSGAFNEVADVRHRKVEKRRQANAS
jgi:hypothetical protein